MSDRLEVDGDLRAPSSGASTAAPTLATPGPAWLEPVLWWGPWVLYFIVMPWWSVAAHFPPIPAVIAGLAVVWLAARVFLGVKSKGEIVVVLLIGGYELFFATLLSWVWITVVGIMRFFGWGDMDFG
jgi:hypothetical protein